MADGQTWKAPVSRETLQELADRQAILALLRRCPGGLTSRQIADGLRMDARQAAGALRYMREDGLVESRNVSAGRKGGTVLSWTAAPVVPSDGTPGPKRRPETRMLPVFHELHVDAIMRRDCRHETECVTELDDAYPEARHAVCREDCVYFQAIPPVAVGSAPSMLARAQTMIDMDVEFTVEERRRITAGRSWRKASAASKEAAASRAGGKR